MEPLGRKLNSIDPVVKKYGIVLAVLLFAGFPIALFIPIGHGYNIFSFFFPAFLAASGFSAAMLVMLRRGKEKLSILEICFAVLFLSMLVSTLLNSSPGAEFLKYSGLALIPLATALSVKEKPEFILKVLKWGGCLLWLANIIHCYSHLPEINRVGISGNQNWLSALILASAPLAVWVLSDVLGNKIKQKKISIAVSVLIILGISIPIVSAADSRASYVTLIALPVYLAFVLCSKRVKLIILALIILCAVAVPFLFKDQINRENSRNVRVPMWSATLSMVSNNPLGVGPGKFESRFPEFVTKEQKVMLVSAETTAHPHNEFLHVMTLGGVPAGLSWVIIVGFAMFYRVSKKEELYFLIPIFILFVQGMMDKPLFQMPTMLFFYVLIGGVLGQKDLLSLSLKKPDREKLNLYKTIAVIIILGFGYFISTITASSWYERQAIIAEQKKDKVKALALYEKSFNYADWRLFPLYKAFLISTIDKPDVVKALDFYDALEARAPDYRQFNLLKGSLFTQLALQDKEQMKSHLESAWKSYNRACELNITNVLSFVDRMKFASRFLGAEELEKSYTELCNLYRYKAKASERWLKESLTEWGDDWRKNKKFSEFLTASEGVFNMMKPTYFHSVYFPADMREILPAFGGPLNIGDMVFAIDSYSLIDALPKGNFETKAAYLFNEIGVDNNAAFSWPRVTLQKKAGSQLSKLSLIAMTARNFGYDPFIIRSNNSLFLLKEGSFHVLDKTGLKVLDTTATQKFINGKLLEYFDYPQAYFYKNEFLSFILDEAGATPQYCRNPDFVINNLLKRISTKNTKVAIVKEPFFDILQRMKSQRAK